MDTITSFFSCFFFEERGYKSNISYRCFGNMNVFYLARVAIVGQFGQSIVINQTVTVSYISLLPSCSYLELCSLDMVGYPNSLALDNKCQRKDILNDRLQ